MTNGIALVAAWTCFLIGGTASTLAFVNATTAITPSSLGTVSFMIRLLEPVAGAEEARRRDTTAATASTGRRDVVGHKEFRFRRPWLHQLIERTKVLQRSAVARNRRTQVMRARERELHCIALGLNDQLGEAASRAAQLDLDRRTRHIDRVDRLVGHRRFEFRD